MSGPAVIVIDDDPSVRRGIARLLRASGFSVRTCASAEELLANPPAPAGCCLVLDIHLGGMSGLDLAACLDRQGCAVPIVFISAQDGRLPASRSTRPGTIAFLHKPFDESVIIDAVTRALAAARG